MNSLFSVIYFIFLLNFASGLFDLEENVSCPSHVSGQYGICLEAPKCKTFKTELHKLGICSFNGGIPIVCCPENQNSVTKIANVNIKRISSNKCEEFIEPKTSVRFNPASQFRPPDIQHFVGGTKIDTGFNFMTNEFPHMSVIGIQGLRNQTNWLCGGSLISDKFVLSAAHCAFFGRIKPDIIRVGDIDLLRTELGIFPQEFKIKIIFVHPQYKTNLKYHDLALFELSTTAQFTKDVFPACLFQESNDPDKTVEAMGYGQTSFGGQQSNELLKGFLTIVNKSQCNTAYEDDSLELPQGITSSQICAWDPQGKRDTCQGDSGGPLQITKYSKSSKKYYEIVGITSFGKFCAAGSPGVYVRVSAYLDWIESIVWK